MKILLSITSLGFALYAINCNAALIESSGIMKSEKRVASNWRAAMLEGNGIIESEKRKISDFNSIDISGYYEVEITSQKAPSLEISGDSNILPLILTEVINGVLVISSNRSFATKNILKLKISAINLEKLSSSGASRIVVDNLNNERLNVNASGAGSTEIGGKTKELYINTSGSVNLKAKNLYSDKVNIDLSGASNVAVYAAEELNAKVSGVGHINYYGNPKVVNRDVSGLGVIKKQ